jgi:hypothetical protein
VTENEYTTGTLEVLLSVFMSFACGSEERCHIPENLEANLSNHLHYVTPNPDLWAEKNCA